MIAFKAWIRTHGNLTAPAHISSLVPLFVPVGLSTADMLGIYHNQPVQSVTGVPSSVRSPCTIFRQNFSAVVGVECNTLQITQEFQKQHSNKFKKNNFHHFSHLCSASKKTNKTQLFVKVVNSSLVSSVALDLVMLQSNFFPEGLIEVAGSKQADQPLIIPGQRDCRRFILPLKAIILSSKLISLVRVQYHCQSERIVSTNCFILKMKIQQN